MLENIKITIEKKNEVIEKNRKILESNKQKKPLKNDHSGFFVYINSVYKI